MTYVIAMALWAGVWQQAVLGCHAWVQPAVTPILSATTVRVTLHGTEAQLACADAAISGASLAPMARLAHRTAVGAPIAPVAVTWPGITEARGPATGSLVGGVWVVPPPRNCPGTYAQRTPAVPPYDVPGPLFDVQTDDPECWIVADAAGKKGL